LEFEIIEEYIIQGDRRFRLRVKGTEILINVSANSREEALEKAKKLYARIQGKFRDLA
jgi:hypothetical protein